MKSNSRILITLAAMLALHLLAGAPSMAQAEDPDAYGDDYQLGNFGRVQYQENGVTILRAASNHDSPPLEQAQINAPVFPGDSVVTGYDQRAELQLARGSLVRIDRASEITFLALTDPYAEFPDNTILQLSEGTIQISALLEDREEFRIDTPACSIYLLGDGDFRIEVSSQGRTQVVSHRGVAEVVGSSGSVLVRGGMLAEVYPGSVPHAPEPFNTFASDAFDHWVDERDAVYTVRDRYAGSSGQPNIAYEELPYEVRPYYRELNAHGSWVYVEDYGSVWHPSGVSPSWRPYYDGYWNYGPQGYFWVSSEPWGWAPYHYGRWSYVSRYGWCWIPGRVFGGAWVAWSWGSLHVGWAPLGYWNRPVWYNSLHYGYYDPYCWTFVNYNHLHHQNYRRHAVPWNQVNGHVQRYAVVTRPPRVSPRQLANSDEYRKRAYREASNNNRGRIKPVMRDSRPSRNVRDLERGLSRRVADARNKTGRSPAERRAGPDRASGSRSGARSDNRVDRGKLTIAREPGRGGEARERGMPSYPRQISAKDADGRRGTAAGQQRRTGDSGRRDNGRSTPLPQVKPRQQESGATNERIRDLYRKMSAPRTTTEQKSGSSSQRSGRTRESSSPKKTTAPRRETSARKPQSGSRPSGSQQKARPPKRSTSKSGSGGTQPRASSRNNSARPQSTSPRAGSRSSTSRSSRPAPKARSSSSRSSGSTPKAKSGSSRSSGSSAKSRGSSSRSSSGRKGGKK